MREFGATDKNGRWVIEGYGVDPDIVIEQDSVEGVRGRLFQLERGVEEAIKRLPAAPGGLPQRAEPPVKVEVH